MRCRKKVLAGCHRPYRAQWAWGRDNDQPALLIQRCMKCGDVAESDKKFGIFPDRLKIDEIQQTREAP